MGLLVWFGLRRPNIWERRTLLDKFLESPLQWLVFTFFQLVLFLRGRPFRPPRDKPPIRVVCLSDTHDGTVAVPDGDLLIHAGDLTNPGTAADIQRQVDWLDSLPHQHKVFVCGNHDSWFDPTARVPEDRKTGAEVNLKGLKYLENSAVTLEFRGGRKLNVFGNPALPRCGGDNFAFQYDRQNHPWDDSIPDETDVLVTHTPPRYHMDLGLGCAGLLKEVWRVKPKLHVFGHVHWGHGKQAVFFDQCQLAYESLMARPKKGPIHDLLPSASWWDAFDVVWYGVKSILWQYLMLGPGSNNGAMFVNAAVMYGNTGKVKPRVQIIEL
ncbi:calcineurin-like phosphoesterase [Thozetella sp. PMI_491]|nr:calcineurin-like phosphoesterase [Thozetella sp. PMI_491]